MKSILFLVAMISFFGIVRAHKPFIVLKNGDTLFVKSIKEGYGKRVKATLENGKKKVFRARNTHGYGLDSTYYDALRVCPMIIGWKSWSFQERVITGAVNMYVCTGTTTSHHVTFTGNEETNHTTGSAYWLRKSDEPQGKAHKIITFKWARKYLGTCPGYSRHLESWEGLYDQIAYYNSHCK